MILGSMIAAAVAGALALPAAGIGGGPASAGRGADTPPAAASTNPLVSLAGDGFAAIGDIFHAVPVLGPLATGIAADAFCAVGSVPLFGDVTKASVSKFDKDTQQGNGCTSSTGSASTGSASTGSGSSGSGSLPSFPPLSSGKPSLSSGKPSNGSLTIKSTSSNSTTVSGMAGTPASDHGGNTSNSTGASISTQPTPPSSTVSSSADHSSASADHSSASDHGSSADHTSGADHTSSTNHVSTSDHTSATDHTSAADHTSATGHAAAPTSSSAGKHVTAAQDVTFPAGKFELRQGSGDNQNCLVKGIGSAAVPGPCDAAAAWIYQSSAGELHPATDSAACLLAASKNLEMVTVNSCASATTWTKHWYLSGTRRLFVRDTDEHGSWRFLGAPGALVVGGVDQRNIPAVPVWSFPGA
jgi:hypothetical protein